MGSSGDLRPMGSSGGLRPMGSSGDLILDQWDHLVVLDQWDLNVVVSEQWSPYHLCQQKACDCKQPCQYEGVISGLHCSRVPYMYIFTIIKIIQD